MIQLIIGNRGSGKTKKLIAEVAERLRNSNGNVVVIEKGSKLTYDISHQARLIQIDEYKIKGFDALYGFMAGICAGNYDVTDILIDGTLKIGGRNFDELEGFIVKLKKLAEDAETAITLSVSADESDLSTKLLELVTVK